MSLLAPAAYPENAPQQNFGAVFTRRWVVDLILDLSGYTADVDLTQLTAVEPSVGDGAFLSAMADRLLTARATHAPDATWASLAGCIRAWDLQESHVKTCRELASASLRAAGCPAEIANSLATSWVRAGDFLLDTPDEEAADFVLGNPPYIRIEDLAPDLLAAYRRACPTMGGRADVYIGFLERSLDLLKPGGRLGFICADRWMRNQYGKRLRQKIAKQGFALDYALTMHEVSAFAVEVSAYPAITVLRHGPQRTAILGNAAEAFGPAEATRFQTWALTDSTVELLEPSVTGARLPHWQSTADSWPDGSPHLLAWLDELNERFHPLESSDSHTRISIGVATGADAVYVTKNAEAAEPERMLPLAMAADIASGTFIWGGNYLVNPWEQNGLVSLADWPELRRYLTQNSAAVRGRAIAKKNERTWHRTIDRVTLPLTKQPMLLLQDMKARIHPVLAPAGFYPHHNLYYIVSETWDLEVLGGLLLSEAVERQVAAYCVKMRGGTLRFQAQYLRRVRVPQQEEIHEVVQEELRLAFRSRDRDRANTAALLAYGLESLPD
ncbi:Eco57I restriction-modification methylase domain-containing protein [Streptomyces bluensis]|uniref:Eco57I restriction-modification methylase domain-containing protein n=1 Tax=Streptomyces bluensis TaxID=33897 RepID=UPI001677A9A3|nr:Eco57I restriction-modification methylase domain-containing protein [Streptomyces bluensis]GGZ76475.1 type II DNA modification methyltransferase [Streptomyces bluensis]